MTNTPTRQASAIECKNYVAQYRAFVAKPVGRGRRDGIAKRVVNLLPHAPLPNTLSPASGSLRAPSPSALSLRPPKSERRNASNVTANARDQPRRRAGEAPANFGHAREVERRGFAGIYIPSRFGNMAQCTALALATERIVFGTAIAPIYAHTPEDFAQSAAYLHEISGCRFRSGIGIAHGPDLPAAPA